MEFLRDYVGIFPAVIAVFNGMLAVFSAHYPFKTPRAKAFFIALVGVLSLSAISATFYTQHLVIVRGAEERVRRNMIRDELGTFISQGMALLNITENPTAPIPTEAANGWASEAESFLSDKLGGSYVVRFRDSTGMPPVSPTGVDEQHQRLWRGIYSRMLRLEQFSQELPAT